MFRAFQSAPSKGFTLLELLIAIGVISILAAFSLPTYVRYLNEAKAAEFLVRIHRIALAYHEVLLVDIPKQQDLRSYDSPRMGEPPKQFNDLAAIYAKQYGIELGSFLVNHSNYFGTISDGEIPVLFLKANTDAGRDVLHALDHVTQNQHSFANPSLMIIALEDPVQRQSAAGTGSGGTTPDTSATDTSKSSDPKPSDPNPLVNPVATGTAPGPGTSPPSSSTRASTSSTSS